VPDGPLDSELLRPDGSLAASQALALEGAPRAPSAAGHFRVDLDTTGRWHLRVGSLLDAPLDVVAGKPRNRRPNPLGGVELSPAAPAANEVVFCLVRTSLVTEDPDYDLVRYRYRWLVGGQPFRTVWSGGLSDAIPRATALPGQRLTCRVTPSDGWLAGPTASVTGIVR
jgi:hypothetical protein